MKRMTFLLLVCFSLIMSGCATIKQDRNFCIVTGALVGAAAGAIAEDDNKPEVAVGTAVIGGIVGWMICQADADNDGVADTDDKCAMTPAAAKVDSTGCPVDSDFDGVADYLDACPATVRDAKVDAQGCALDTDGDGVTDHRDQCPNTPKGAKVNSKGCALDSDGDGIADSKDQCPGTPAGTKVDMKGCSADKDQDGVSNNMDQCPATPAGKAVDDKGCHTMFSLTGLNFDNNSFTLTAAAQGKLVEVISALKENGNIKVRIEGHTDSSGDESYNQHLSEQRADSVMQYLISKGIAAARMETKGYGESSPIASNDDRNGRAQNRRVDFKVTDN